MKRVLASIQQIRDIQPIPDASAIDVATIKGWKVVVKKGEFKIDDLCVYVEIDSFLPIIPEFEFLRKSSYKKLADDSEGFRIRTCRMRGQISQGLVLPLSLFPNLTNTDIGVEVTNELGIIKYDPPLPPELVGKVKGVFPTSIKCSDKERIQNLWYDYKERFNDLQFETTLKIDGTSCTFYHNKGEVGVCSRNLEFLPNPDSTQGRLEAKYNIYNKLKSSGRNVALQMELFGEGVQGNPEKIKGQELAIYDVFDIDTYSYLTPRERIDFLTEIELIDIHIPILETVSLTRFNTVEDILAYAEGKSLNPKTEREGLVFKSLTKINDQVISFKVISNKFLLTEKA